MSPKSAYLLRCRPGAESFAAAWDKALHEGQRRALTEVMQHSLQPPATPVFYRGLQVGTRTTPNDRLLLAALRVMARGGGSIFGSSHSCDDVSGKSLPFADAFD
ncbi:hypothetical protein [Sphingomonas sp. ID0503]|uniref:hypothetical protein n=1 Tax=Sphingomonas sp. ID0503 TaxID=3399691 RepID=UPI003AFA43EE